MDEQLKARLIGAVILVALAVFLIPELLSGRKAETPDTAAPGEGRGTRTVTIDLSGTVQPIGAAPAKPESAITRPPALPTPLDGPSAAVLADAAASKAGPVDAAPAGEQQPAATTEVASPAANRASPALKPAPVASTPVATAPPPPSPANPSNPAAAAAKGGWSVQVGAFGSSATASKLVADLKGDGYNAYLSPISKGGKTLHRVRVGPEAARPDADRLAAKLKGRGLPATVVAND